MFGDKFMGFGGFPGDFNRDRRLPDLGLPGDFNRDRRLPDLGLPGDFLPPSMIDRRLPSLDTNPFLKNQSLNTKTGNALDLCKKLSKMGISCDMSIWTEPEPPLPFRVDPVDFGSRAFRGFDDGGASRSYYNVSSARQAFLQNTSRGVSPGELRFLALQESQNPNGFRETMMMDLNNHRDFLSEPINRSLGNDAFKRSLMMFEEKRVSRTLAAMEGRSGASSYPEDTMIRQGKKSPFNDIRTGLPLNMASMVKIYGSVNLMAKDQVGCRVLQRFVEEGTVHESKAIFVEIIGHVVELSADPFGNYFIQKLLDVCTEDQRTMILSVLTSTTMDFIKICLNSYGTRVVQKIIETVKTKDQIALVKSGVKSGFLALVKDLNGNHVILTCLKSLSPNDNKFVLEAATRYCAEIATHRHGCCVLQSCVSNSVGLQRERLVSEISRNSLHLSQDPFGNYVVQFLIGENVSAVKFLTQFRTHYAELATQKFSSHVVEKCLRQYPECRAEIVRELLSVPNFEHLLQDPYANYVIQTAIIKTKGPVHARLVEKVYRHGRLARSSPYCKKIFSKTIFKK